MGVRYLLDTHVLLWLTVGSGQVPDTVLDELSDPVNRVLVSAASAFEIATKARLGKLPEGQPLIDSWRNRLVDMGLEELAITAEHARLAGQLVWKHADPFDRLLIAQTEVENLTLVTTDRMIRKRPALRILSWN